MFDINADTIFWICATGLNIINYMLIPLVIFIVGYIIYGLKKGKIEMVDIKTIRIRRRKPLNKETAKTLTVNFLVDDNISKERIYEILCGIADYADVSSAKLENKLEYIEGKGFIDLTKK